MKKIVFTSLGLLLLIACSKEENPVIPEEIEQNTPPTAFGLISPAEGAEIDVYNITFEWEPAQDPENDNVTYDLYLYDSGASPIRLATNLTETSYTLEERYTFNSSGSWYVVANDGKIRGETTSTERNFTTRNVQSEQLLNNDSALSYTARTTYTSLYFNNTFFIINGYGETGYHGDVWTSKNYGTEWLLENDLTGSGFQRSGHSSVVFNDKMWVIGGNYNSEPLKEVYSSNNGTNWNEETFASAFMARYDHTSVVFKDQIWVIGGYGTDSFGNDAFIDNVISWTGRSQDPWVVEANAGQTPFNGIRGHSSVVYDNKIWVIGGIDEEDHQNKVWTTTDGITWISETEFPQRFAHHKSVVFDDKIWVIGGATKTGSLNEVFYYSKETNTWTRYTMPPEFTERNGHGVLVVDEGRIHDGIYIFGDNNSNDVWKLY